MTRLEHRLAPALHFTVAMLRFMLIAILGACTVGGSGGGGGGGGKGDGTGGGDMDMLVDGGPGTASATCTGAAYDPCSDPSQCASGKCQLYQQSGFQVCTQTCTPGDSTTCPMQNGQAATCNNMGLCKPAMANGCTR